MKYGVFLPNFGPFGDAQIMANLARDAEGAGWDGFFIWDHVSRPHPLDHWSQVKDHQILSRLKNRAIC